MPGTADDSALSEGTCGETVYAVPFPLAMYARDILGDRSFADAMGYAWLHDDETEFARVFRMQVMRQAELYEAWLNGDPNR